jgi:hypothetical protein
VKPALTRHSDHRYPTPNNLTTHLLSSNTQYPIANMKLAVIVATGLSVLAELASAGGGFCQSCKSSVGLSSYSPSEYSWCPNTVRPQWHIEGNHYMIDECRKNNGAYRRTRQDLNLCVGNFDSKMGSANKYASETSSPDPPLTPHDQRQFWKLAPVVRTRRGSYCRGSTQPRSTGVSCIVRMASRSSW